MGCFGPTANKELGPLHPSSYLFLILLQTAALQMRLRRWSRLSRFRPETTTRACLRTRRSSSWCPSSAALSAPPERSQLFDCKHAFYMCTALLPSGLLNTVPPVGNNFLYQCFNRSLVLLWERWVNLLQCVASYRWAGTSERPGALQLLPSHLERRPGRRNAKVQYGWIEIIYSLTLWFLSPEIIANFYTLIIYI